MNISTIGIIGLGLIGGSIARGLKKANPGLTVVAYNRNTQVLYNAKKDGAADIICEEINESFRDCDIFFLCTPVSLIRDFMKKTAPYLKKDAILTDVGSTKASIVNTARELGLEEHFLGGHPMAGSERFGYAYSSDHLIENAYYVLTPTAKNTERQIACMVDAIRDLNALPLILPAERHDYIVGAVSHLPHIIASSLVGLISRNDTENQLMKQIAAGGFKDITRIASSSPQMWSQICEDNKENISLLVDKYIDALRDVQSVIVKNDSDRIFDFFKDAKEYRDSITDRAFGPIKKEFALYSDILDEPGSIAAVTTYLAVNQVSLKNIGIIHNRDFEAGVLKLEFYDEDSVIQASRLLKKHRYQVSLR